MKKRIASLLLAFLMLMPLAASVFPIHIHADSLYCEGCGGWRGDDVNWCSNDMIPMRTVLQKQIVPFFFPVSI